MHSSLKEILQKLDCVSSQISKTSITIQGRTHQDVASWIFCKKCSFSLRTFRKVSSALFIIMQCFGRFPQAYIGLYVG